MSPVKNIFSIVKSRLITEKSAADSVYRKYAFWVHRNANKMEIKRAVEKVYSVKVAAVHSMMVKGKIKRIRWNQPGKKSDWKKAVVTLKKGFEIKEG